MQGTQRYVVFAYLALGLVVWGSLAKLFGAIAYAVDLPDPHILGANFTLSTLIGLVLTLGVGLYAYRRPDANSFSQEVVGELRKVTWPSRKETQTATVVVIVTTLILALILGLFDLAWAELTGFIYT